MDVDTMPGFRTRLLTTVVKHALVLWCLRMHGARGEYSPIGGIRHCWGRPIGRLLPNFRVLPKWGNAPRIRKQNDVYVSLKYPGGVMWHGLYSDAWYDNEDAYTEHADMANIGVLGCLWCSWRWTCWTSPTHGLSDVFGKILKSVRPQSCLVHSLATLRNFECLNMF